LDLKDIKELIALMKKNDLSVFKMEKEGFKITLKKGTDFEPASNGAPSYASAPAPAVSAAPAPVTPASTAPAESAAADQREINSPMVGTFYGASAPDAPAFISVGQVVTPETVVCIIEAMKVMNEIKAELSGTITEILAENGKPVQFGQPLFRVK
jgi:acetyl-CoA carboxylase biotin carboxyl carrier protein